MLEPTDLSMLQRDTIDISNQMKQRENLLEHFVLKCSVSLILAFGSVLKSQLKCAEMWTQPFFSGVVVVSVMKIRRFKL